MNHAELECVNYFETVYKKFSQCAFPGIAFFGEE